MIDNKINNNNNSKKCVFVAHLFFLLLVCDRSCMNPNIEPQGKEWSVSFVQSVSK